MRAGRPLLVCLGEALVDLICPDPLDDPSAARRFEVHFGGALSNVAVAAARAGARVALAGGHGDDAWGRFLRERLRAEGVELGFQATLEGLQTPFAFATLDREREPAFEIHGRGIEPGIASLRGREDELVAAAGAIAFSSNTFTGEALPVTRAVAERAAAAGVPLLFDPNLRPGRWRELEQARELCHELARPVTVLKCNLQEAGWLLGEEQADPAAAAEGLLELGPALAVVTSGAGPAVARGAASAEATPEPVEVVSPLGAGDVFMGTLAARLLDGDFDLARTADALAAATRAATAACRRLGAVD